MHHGMLPRCDGSRSSFGHYLPDSGQNVGHKLGLCCARARTIVRPPIYRAAPKWMHARGRMRQSNMYIGEVCLGSVVGVGVLRVVDLAIGRRVRDLEDAVGQFDSFGKHEHTNKSRTERKELDIYLDHLSVPHSTPPSSSPEAAMQAKRAAWCSRAGALQQRQQPPTAARARPGIPEGMSSLSSRCQALCASSPVCQLLSQLLAASLTLPSTHAPLCPSVSIPLTQLSTTPSIFSINPSRPFWPLFARAMASKT